MKVSLLKSTISEELVNFLNIFLPFHALVVVYTNLKVIISKRRLLNAQQGGLEKETSQLFCSLVFGANWARVIM